jgi:hypothetical protein
VLVLLALFAAVGLAFVFYSANEADSARYYREAATTERLGVDPEHLSAFFLNQLIYDRVDDDSGIFSALRGHSLARSMFGWNDETVNETPFNGTGRLHFPSPFANASFADAPPLARDDFYLVNYTFFRDDAQAPAEQRFLRDPERVGVRAGPGAPRGRYLGGFNAPYTYPDLNNLFLAAVRADGTVLMPSFHRPWLFGSNDPETNPNWTNVAGKYLLLRPRPIDMGPGFPYPGEGGDVKNLVGAPGDNDSYWIDLDFPVLRTRDGRKYKALFAPLIVDLDARVNLSVHGNARARDVQGRPVHASNQGWGPWEVNPGYVLRKQGTNGPEWPDLLLGTRGSPGRYGPDQQPGTAGTQAAWLPSGPFYSRTDADACRAAAGGLVVADLPPLLPGAGAPDFSCFPLYRPGYDNGSGDGPLTERWQHPLLAGLTQPLGDDRPFLSTNMVHFVGDWPSPASAYWGAPGALSARNFTDPRARRLVTVLSADVDRPGVTPWVTDPTRQPYLLRPGDANPHAGPIPFPRFLASSPAPKGGEFGPDWRAIDAALGRVDLDRSLPPYPPADPATGRITDLAGLQKAQQARTDLARDIYDRLRRATGAADPNGAAAQAAAGAPAAFDALRWLAQLAVNIVDFIDPDDYLTPLDWFSGPGGSQVVLGTELPRLVVNEAYVEAANDPHDPTLPQRASLPYKVNFWVELHNPFFADPALSEGGAARLEVPASEAGPGYPVYRLVVARAPNSGLNRPGQVLGDPDPGHTVLVVSSFAPAPAPAPPSAAGVDTTVVLPAGGAFMGTPGSNEGFFVLGPVQDFPGTDPARPQATLRVADAVLNGARSALTYELPLTTALDQGLPQHTLLLQRLACPALPPNPAVAGGAIDPGQPYNPYVTIDYVDTVPTNDGIVADLKGPRRPTALSQRHSYGKSEPYAGHPSQQRPQQPQPSLPHQPQHTFFRHNSVEAAPPVSAATPGQTLRVPFDWPAHLDRPPVSPAELLLVSGFKPHQLTHQFVTPAGPQRHLAPWLDSHARIYRALEFLRSRPATASALGGTGGRVPGEVNVNTLWDPEVLLAVCDPQPANNFSAGDLYAPLGAGPGTDSASGPQTVYWRMMATRTPGLLTGSGPGPDDRPFWGLAAPFTAAGQDQYPTGKNVEDTVLRSFSGSGARRLFEPALAPAAHPYLRYQLLTKIFNHLTTRSNVFAVWVTVGYFEVTDDTVRPVKLGAELGSATRTNVRPRLFAVVDRSRLSAFATTSTTAVAAPGRAEVSPAAMTSTGAAGRPWGIGVGSVLTVDQGNAEETVVVTAVTATTFTATFTRRHRAGFRITCPGNPGPLPIFKFHEHPTVVPAYDFTGG